MSRKEARRADRFTQFALAAAARGAGRRRAGDRATRTSARSAIGSIVGTGIGGLATLENNQEQLLDRGAAAVSPLAVPLMMGNAGAAAIALRHGLLGPCFGVVSACAAGDERDRQRAARDPGRRGRRRSSPAAPRPR